MARYISFHSKGDLFQFGKLKKNLTQIKAVKEKNGVAVFALAENKLILLQAGYTASESGGVVTVTEPPGWLAKYKADAKANEKENAKKLFKEYRDDIGSTDGNISTYKTSLKDYFISDIQTPVNAAADKAAVDVAVAAIDWSTVVVP